MLTKTSCAGGFDREEASGCPLLGQAPTFLKVLERLNSCAAYNAAVLIEGETGTGKELVARQIHQKSARAGRPFVIINCAAIPDTLIEDELFGHARGAFTDAQHERIGLVTAADGGTFCLDEIGSLSARGQAALLRLVQDRTFRILGSNHERCSDVRFMALTNVLLSQLVHRGAFRPDLYYRLRVLTVHVPPLRERVEDIVPLADHFLRTYARADNPVRTISTAARAVLQAYDWPGNVRQLEHAMIFAACLATGSTVSVADLDLPDINTSDSIEAGSGHEPLRVLKRQVIESFERRYLTELMQHCRGNIAHAARVARKDRRDLGRLLKKYQISPPRRPGA